MLQGKVKRKGNDVKEIFYDKILFGYYKLALKNKTTKNKL